MVNNPCYRGLTTYNHDKWVRIANRLAKSLAIQVHPTPALFRVYIHVYIYIYVILFMYVYIYIYTCVCVLSTLY